MNDNELDLLIESVRQGDEDAMHSLVEQYGDAIRREVRFTLLDRRLRRVVSESDICQSVFTKFFVDLWSGKYEFDSPAQLMGLLKTMVRSKVADVARHWTAQRRDIRLDVSPGSHVPLGENPHVSTPSQIVMKRELLDQVAARMTDWDRQVLEMRRQKKTWAQIAEQLDEGAGPEAVRKRYSRAMENITEELGLDSL